MRLSDFQGEAALDLIADLIEPFGEIATDADFLKLYRGGERIQAASKVIKNHKKAIIKILALLDGVPVEEYKVNVFTLTAKLVELFNDLEAVDLFLSQGQTGDAKSSGSASVNTEE